MQNGFLQPHVAHYLQLCCGLKFDLPGFKCCQLPKFWITHGNYCIEKWCFSSVVVQIMICRITNASLKWQCSFAVSKQWYLKKTKTNEWNSLCPCVFVCIFLISLLYISLSIGHLLFWHCKLLTHSLSWHWKDLAYIFFVLFILFIE